MPSEREKLETIRDQILDRITEVTSSPKPDYTEEGQTFKWADYLSKLRGMLADANAQIKEIDRAEDTIFEYQQTGGTS